MKYIALPVGIVAFNVLGNLIAPSSLPLACLYFLASGLLLGHLAHLAYYGSKSDGNA